MSQKIGCTTISISEVDAEMIKTLRDKFGFNNIESVISILIDYSIDRKGCNTFPEYIYSQYPSKN